jgi:hypothetical protein
LFETEVQRFLLGNFLLCSEVPNIFCDLKSSVACEFDFWAEFSVTTKSASPSGKGLIFTTRNRSVRTLHGRVCDRTGSLRQTGINLFAAAVLCFTFVASMDAQQCGRIS